MTESSYFRLSILFLVIRDLESEIRCERIEAQRLELERERQQFVLQQEERQRRWHREREELLQAQKKLDEVSNHLT